MDIRGALQAAKRETNPQRKWDLLKELSRTRLDFLQIAGVDRLIQQLLARREPVAAPRLRLAMLASSTTGHLLPALRVAGLRRGLVLDLYPGAYGQIRQELAGEALGRFAPDFILLSFTAEALLPPLALGDAAAEEAAIAAALEELRSLWRSARRNHGAAVLQQTALDMSQPLFGLSDAEVPGTPSAAIRRLNVAMAGAAREEGVLLFDLDRLVRRIGSAALIDPTRWHQAKQEIAPAQAPLYADALARQLMAARGLSRKCLVLDLDNTLWGGVIGDDGLDGIRIGQGSPEGEAYAAFQHYVKRLGERGVVLAVSSKNDPAIAMEAFERHPEMVLKPSDIAVFEANWRNKPAALQRIAGKLGFGLDALVFFDDNPAERALIRATLPEVAVPEAPGGPELYAQCLADSGWFEAVAFTPEDAGRTSHYRAEAQRAQAAEAAPDLDGFLASLAMELRIEPLDRLSLPRATQLVNKTNQFNLTTRRSHEAEMARLAADPAAVVLTARLKDKFGDNGLISVAVGRLAQTSAGESALDIEIWVMSCRVLGRRVEYAMRDALAQAARERGTRWLIGHYRPTPRNGVVAQLFPELGFEAAASTAEGATDWRLDLDRDLPPWPSPFRGLAP